MIYWGSSGTEQTWRESYSQTLESPAASPRSLKTHDRDRLLNMVPGAFLLVMRRYMSEARNLG